MARTGTQAHVSSFLNLADVDTAMLDTAGWALRSALRRRSAREALRIAEHWANEQLERFDVTPESASTNDDVIDLLAALRLVAEALPTNHRRQRPRLTPARMRAFLDEMESDFLAELLAETRRRSADAPLFAARLKESRGAVESLAQRSRLLNADLIVETPDGLADDAEKEPPIVVFADNAAPIFTGVIVVLIGLYCWIRWGGGSISKDDDDGDDDNGDDNGDDDNGDDNGDDTE